MDIGRLSGKSREGDARMDEASQSDMWHCVGRRDCDIVPLRQSKYGSLSSIDDRYVDDRLRSNSHAYQHDSAGCSTASHQCRDTAQSRNRQGAMEADRSCASEPTTLGGRPPETPTTSLKYPGIQLEPETQPITLSQLVNEVKGIYVGLVMVESKCIEIEIDSDQRNAQTKFTDEQWQALITLHRTLLHEHHDFMAASQHPSGSPVLRRLAQKYAMPARMRRHGIHSFLELLRHRLPDSQEHMVTFIYLAYSMVALLFETVPAFEDTWIECLGDLSRYRMAIEDDNQRIRDTWANVSHEWYTLASRRAPTTSRLYHRAIIFRQRMIRQLYYYPKSLCYTTPFSTTHESILTIFDPILYSVSSKNTPCVNPIFIRIYAIITSQELPIQIWRHDIHNFFDLLRHHVSNSQEPPIFSEPLQMTSEFHLDSSSRHKPPDNNLFASLVSVEFRVHIPITDPNNHISPARGQLTDNIFHCLLDTAYSSIRVYTQAMLLFIMAQWNRATKNLALFRWESLDVIWDPFLANYDRYIHFDIGRPMAMDTSPAKHWIEIESTKQCSPGWWPTLCRIPSALHVSPEDKGSLSSWLTTIKERLKPHLESNFEQGTFSVWDGMGWIQNMNPYPSYHRIKLAFPFYSIASNYKVGHIDFEEHKSSFFGFHAQGIRALLGYY